MPLANYLGWRNLQSYDPSNCSALCNATSTCRSFNMCMFLTPPCDIRRREAGLQCVANA